MRLTSVLDVSSASGSRNSVKFVRDTNRARDNWPKGRVKEAGLFGSSGFTAQSKGEKVSVAGKTEPKLWTYSRENDAYCEAGERLNQDCRPKARQVAPLWFPEVALRRFPGIPTRDYSARI